MCFTGDNFFSWFGHFCFSLDRQLVTFVCLFSTVRFQMSLQMPEKRHSRIGCICLAFLHCVFSNVSSNCLGVRMQSHIGCICSTFLHCAFSNVSSNCLPKKRHNHIGYICLTFLHCAFFNVSSNGLPDRMQNHTGCICLTF